MENMVYFSHVIGQTCMKSCHDKTLMDRKRVVQHSLYVENYHGNFENPYGIQFMCNIWSIVSSGNVYSNTFKKCISKIS